MKFVLQSMLMFLHKIFLQAFSLALKPKKFPLSEGGLIWYR